MKFMQIIMKGNNDDDDDDKNEQPFWIEKPKQNLHDVFIEETKKNSWSFFLFFILSCTNIHKFTHTPNAKIHFNIIWNNHIIKHTWYLVWYGIDHMMISEIFFQWKTNFFFHYSNQNLWRRICFSHYIFRLYSESDSLSWKIFIIKILINIEFVDLKIIMIIT